MNGGSMNPLDESQFRASLRSAVPPPGLAPVLVALWYEGCGDWQRAHKIAQAESSDQAARVHAYLHRKEGDLANARYWYSRAGMPYPDCGIAEEWQMLVTALLDQHGASAP